MTTEFIATGKYKENGDWNISELFFADDIEQAKSLAAMLFSRYDSAFDTAVAPASPVESLELVIVAQPAGVATGRLVCRRCGTAGRSGDYPFSTLPSSHICDDCAA